MPTKNFEERLKNHANEFHPVVPFEKNDKLLLLDFTKNNLELNAETLEHTDLFIQYINSKLETAGARYGIGGYDEHRTIYSRSKLFSPSPTITSQVEEDAKAPSRWEGDKDSELAEQNYSALEKQKEKRSFSNLSSPPAGGGQEAEPRRLHLGIDIWGKPYTKVMAPLDAIVHSFAFNNTFGDYGATIILTHNLEGEIFIRCMLI